MPIYEYRCAACGHELDELQKLSDAPLKDCPKCGKPELVRLVSAAGFQLKGTGWYQTDFKTKKKDGGGEAKPGEATPAETKAGAPAPAATAAAAPAAAAPAATAPKKD